jgi:hypothetical protein
MKNNNSRKSFQWIFLIISPILSLIAFVLTYFLNPLQYTNQSSLAAIPAFLLSVIILIIGHIIAVFQEVNKVSYDSDRIYEAVKNYLHITKIGTPKKAWEYIIHRLPVLEYVQNTSFNFDDSQTEQSNERLYYSPIYTQSLAKIAGEIKKGLSWKDVGDSTSTERFRQLQRDVENDICQGRYEYRLVERTVPQINFILLTYKDGTTEVLFNWDFRDVPQDPVVLLSRNREIFNMFATQHKGLWRAAVIDYDNIATKSTPKK